MTSKKLMQMKDKKIDKDTLGTVLVIIAGVLWFGAIQVGLFGPIDLVFFLLGLVGGISLITGVTLLLKTS